MYNSRYIHPCTFNQNNLTPYHTQFDPKSMEDDLNNIKFNQSIHKSSIILYFFYHCKMCHVWYGIFICKWWIIHTYVIEVWSASDMSEIGAALEDGTDSFCFTEDILSLSFESVLSDGFGEVLQTDDLLWNMNVDYIVKMHLKEKTKYKIITNTITRFQVLQHCTMNYKRQRAGPWNICFTHPAVFKHFWQLRVSRVLNWIPNGCLANNSE